MRRFTQVDVFTDELLYGNPVAVVHDADRLPEQRLAAFAQWTNLSETTFLMAPTEPGADYRLRIFTPERELPFAGHPTLGSARAWLHAGGAAQGAEIVQECGAGLVRIRRDGDRLAFAAPPLLRSGPVEAADREAVISALRLDPELVRDMRWADNGPGWIAVLVRDAATVLAVEPDWSAIGNVGVVGPYLPGGPADFEVRAFTAHIGGEDPVTGSLNASIAQWLIPQGLAPESYVASQGTVLGRRGRVHLRRDGADIWVGGRTAVGVTGQVEL